MFDPERRAAKREQKDLVKAERERQRQATQIESAAKKKTAQEADAARIAKEQEDFGHLVCEGAFALRTVKIYSHGYVKVAIVMFGKSASFERLVSIDFSGDVQKKTGPGRVGAAVLTGGASLILTSNKRGDVYLTISTDKTTHVLREDPPTALGIRAARQLAAAGQSVLSQLQTDAQDERSGSNSVDSVITPGRSVTDRLQELLELREKGIVTNAEFAEMRSKVLREL